MIRQPSPDSLRTVVARALGDGDQPSAVRAVTESWRPLAASDGAALRDIIGLLPEDAWAREPDVAVALGASYRAGSETASPALAYLAAARASARELGAAVPIRVEAELHSAAALRQVGRIDDAVEHLDEADRLLESAPGESMPWRVGAQAAIAMQRGIVAMHRGELTEAERLLLFADGLADRHLPLAERIECRGALALCAMNSGDLDAADRRAGAVRDEAADSGLLVGGYGAPALLAELNTAIDRFATTRATELLPDALAAAGGTEWEPFALMLAGRLALVEARYVEALDLLRRAAVLLDGWRSERMWTLLGGMMRAQVLIRVGQGDEAWNLLGRLPSTAQHEACTERFVAELRLLNGDVEGASAALEPCEQLGDLHAPRPLIEVQLLRAAIELERNALAASDHWADRALLSMAESGSLMPILFLPDALLDGVRDRALARRQPERVRALLERISQHPRPETGPKHEQLTAREAAVLERLRLGETISGIAATLYLSTNTVKTHLRNIYRKLGVGSREEAVRKASTLGLYLGFTPESPASDRPAR